MMLPSAVTTSNASTLSFMVPYRTELVPEARVDAIPPMLAFAPGSIGKKRPVARSSEFNSLRVSPGSTTQSKSSPFTARMPFICEKSTEIPPRGALTCPSKEVPAPKGTIGTRCSEQIETNSETSAAERGKNTASGRWPASHVAVWQCWSRMDLFKLNLSPNLLLSKSHASDTPVSLRDAFNCKTSVFNGLLPFEICFSPLLNLAKASPGTGLNS